MIQTLRHPTAAFGAVPVVLVVTAVLAVCLGVPAVASAAPRATIGDTKSPGTTTTVPPTTTTLLPVPTLPDHGPGGPNPVGPTGSTTSTSVPIPTTTVPVQVVNSLVRSIQDDLSQLDAINEYDQDKGIVTVNEANAATADSDADLANQTEDKVIAQVSSDRAALADTQHELAALAVALYVRSDVGAAAENADVSNPDSVNGSVLLGMLITHGQDNYAAAKVQLSDDSAVLKLAQQRAAIARAQEALAHATLAKSTTKLTSTKLTAAGQAVTATTGTPLPTIMGPSALSAGELAGWYATTGYRANTTVPMAALAGLYLSTGTTAGLRGDIAFSQSIVETGYFTFPSGGQLLGSDNNFAGIGACDSCAHGWRFPSAQTGVAAQLQLLQAYATTSKIPTPLVGKVSVAGCCQTWLTLSGVWATNPNYGYEILSIYQEILDWAIPQRLAAAGL